MNRYFVAVSTACLVVLVLLVPAAHAGPVYGLIDGNSTATWDLTPGAQLGMISWVVDGVQHDYQQWFWYRVGNTAEASYDTLPLTLSGTSDTNFNGSPETLFAQYTAASFKTSFTFVLTGGTPGSGASDIAESIKIQNTTGSPLDFHFYQYTDFNLANTPANDSVLIVSNNLVRQTDGSGVVINETVLTPPATHHEAALVPFTLNRLNDGVATTLNDVAASGPGNVTWAYEWDVVIPAFGSLLISKDKNIHIVPEPSTLLLGLFAASALAVSIVWRRKR
ncbi:MAG: PEP-CTERM sorting domain-containing protein [Pirellulales bacterium]|nr:PEP-CTERM sorting domain-containing protein [Pirellulales bacterium]